LASFVHKLGVLDS